MKQIFYSGNDRQPCVAEYAIVVDDSGWIQRAHIVVVQSSRKGVWTSLYNTDEGRDNVLNRILAQELPGVRVEFLTFNVILDLSNHMEGLRLPIRLDWDDYIARGNPHDSRFSLTFNIKAFFMQLFRKSYREISIWSGHVVGGCAEFYTDIMDPERHRLDIIEASKLLEQAGYSRSNRRA
ncbi:hypothetical protein [Pseudomonas protegens]|uniref:hypothetical protein n=1 Tax=Pseudomonas protegens TaxID=380021 RepID=UPI001A92784F|nr:hypothetical protein [Pseudomonas protegens]BCT33550.1 hypothetical protein PproGo58_30450 [Pseudomonas protegens]